MSDASLQDRVDEATLDFTLGDSRSAISKLSELTKAHPELFAAWHALAEVYFSEGDHDAALTAGESAHSLDPNDIYINTSLSRIWVALGDKDKAEHFGARVRMLQWKEELKSPSEKDNA